MEILVTIILIFAITIALIVTVDWWHTDQVKRIIDEKEKEDETGF